MQRSKNNGTIPGSQPACAACRHQRKKCRENCILAPYFPADRNREFQAVHKVFGVSNMTKMMKNVNDDQDRRRAVDSLVWEAFCRQKDPVLGPYGEYLKVYDELKMYKSQSQNQMVQLLAQSGLSGWNGGISNGININKGLMGVISEGMINSNNNTLSYNINDNGSGIIDNSYSNYNHSSYVQLNSEKLRHEKNQAASVVVPFQQQQGINGYSQQYYLSGQYSQINSRVTRSPIWEGGA